MLTLLQKNIIFSLSKKKKKMTAFDVDVPNNFYELILKIYIHYDNVFIYYCKDFN